MKVSKRQWLLMMSVALVMMPLASYVWGNVGIVIYAVFLALFMIMYLTERPHHEK